MGYKYRNGQEKNRLIYARWFLTLLTGLITALVAVFMLYFTTLLASLKQHLLEYTIRHELAKHVLFGTTFWSIVAFNLGLVAIAATVTSFGEPVAAGSGTSVVAFRGETGTQEGPLTSSVLRFVALHLMPQASRRSRRL